jgi:hypothetical protein
VKEKFASLRFYIGSVPTEAFDEIYDTIGFFENMSGYVCEECGTTVNVTREGKGWLLTLCKECRAGREIEGT